MPPFDNVVQALCSLTYVAHDLPGVHYHPEDGTGVFHLESERGLKTCLIG